MRSGQTGGRLKLLVPALACALASLAPGSAAAAEGAVFLRDETHALDFDTAERAFHEGRFAAIDTNRTLNLGFDRSTVWLRAELTASTAGDYVVTVGAPTLDVTTLRVVRGDGTFESFRGGLLVPADEQARTRAPSARFWINANEKVILLARAESENELALPLVALRADEYAAQEARSTAWRFLFYGLLIAMALFNLFIFAFTRQLASLVYFGFVTSMMLWLTALDGTMRLYVPQVFEWSPRLPFLLTGFGSVALAPVFLMKVVRVDEVWPRLAKWFPRTLWALAAIATATWLLVDWRTQNIVAGPTAMLSVLGGVAIATARWRTGYAPAGFLVAGWLVLAVGNVLALLSASGVLPPMFEALHAGAAVEALFFSMAVADDARRRADRIRLLHTASARFVPEEFLRLLGRSELPDVARGDQVSRTMTVFFSDIRSFTTLSEQMTAEKTLAFVNEYLDAVEPQIRKHRGVIDKYIGDAVMALFDEPDSALAAAQDIRAALTRLNEVRQGRGEPTIEIGTGIHTGPLVLGTVGTGERLSCTVIGDTVNVASRIEGLTKEHKQSILLSAATAEALKEPSRWRLESVGTVRVRGKQEETALYALADEASGAAAA